MMMPPSIGVPYGPGAYTSAIYPTKIKSILVQCRGKVLDPGKGGERVEYWYNTALSLEYHWFGSNVVDLSVKVKLWGVSNRGIVL